MQGSLLGAQELGRSEEQTRMSFPGKIVQFSGINNQDSAIRIAETTAIGRQVFGQL